MYDSLLHKITIYISTFFLTKTFEHVNNFVISCCLILSNIWTLPLQHFGKRILSFIHTVIISEIIWIMFSRLIVTFSYLSLLHFFTMKKDIVIVWGKKLFCLNLTISPQIVYMALNSKLYILDISKVTCFSLFCD